MGFEKIKKILSRYKKKLKKMFGVEELGVFGSFVKGKQKKKSDVDILVEFDKVPGLIKFIKLENYLANLLGMKVDLVRRKAIREELREVILEETVRLW